MFDASDKYHRLFTVHQNRRWDGEFLLMRDIYHSGDLGQVYRMESRVHGSRGIPGDWRGTPEHGGGMILDWGIHLIDQIMGIVDDKTLRKVFCHCDHITNELVDDGFQLDMFDCMLGTGTGRARGGRNLELHQHAPVLHDRRGRLRDHPRLVPTRARCLVP